MADISSIKLNDTTYNIKDETARNNINSISTNLNNYLPLSGGTATGTIIITNDGAFRVKNDAFNKNVVPASDVTKSPFNVRDANESTIASVRVHQTTDNEIGIGLNALNKDVLTAYVKNDDNKTVRYSIENPDAWRNAINAVNKSGDKVTGQLFIQQPVNNTSVTTEMNFVIGRMGKTYIAGNGYSSGTAWTSIIQQDSTGAYEEFKLPNTLSTDSGSYKILTTKNAITVAQGGTGVTTFTSGAALIGNGSNNITTRSITNNTSKNYITANTNLITAYTLGYWNGAYNNAHASNISYLGTISGGTWQGDAIELNYGGTGGTDSGWKSVTNASAFSGTIYYRKIGHFGEIYAYNIKLANPVSDSSQHVLATIDSAYAPDKGFSMNVGSRYIIAQLLVGSDGKISIYKNTSSQNITTDHTFHLNFTYFI